MNTYAVYGSDGSIKQILTTVDDFAKVDGSVSDTTHYIDTDSGQPKPKKKYEYQLDNEGLVLTITGLPAGVNVNVGFIETVTDSEPTVIEFELPGHYQVALTGHHHYFDEDIEVTVDG
tara:strand:+ start:18604 stop:18957 length:354 start_codon:yes stop_codon:yes gene_type:complete